METYDYALTDRCLCITIKTLRQNILTFYFKMVQEIKNLLFLFNNFAINWQVTEVQTYQKKNILNFQKKFATFRIGGCKNIVNHFSAYLKTYIWGTLTDKVIFVKSKKSRSSPVGKLKSTLLYFRPTPHEITFWLQSGNLERDRNGWTTFYFFSFSGCCFESELTWQVIKINCLIKINGQTNGFVSDKTLRSTNHIQTIRHVHTTSL